ncbi:MULTISPECIES: HalD/BesD family halogenase [Paenibacillus]|uniref:HalD/BesD family halogenase n=1 Tax=Paenibacillus TaxID=44249 RepID=UPI0022B912D6|nr:hypothetical protein [Paenibacillus caseinilyticus]MCZ8522863.1 hypothetical protein [Paenibacillus caseinilyticus]
MFKSQYDIIVENHLNSLSPDYVEGLKEEFKKNQVVILEALLPDPIKRGMMAEAKVLLNEHAARRDLNMRVTEDTPRHYLSVGRDSIQAHGHLIPSFFRSPSIVKFLSEVSGEPVYRVPYEPEEFIINSQRNLGDTHGWHWDDYAFALIWIVEAPAVGDGALVEYIPHTVWDKSDPDNCVSKVLKEHTANSMYVPEGVCYLMKANTTLHRISPLTGDSKRSVIIYSYASQADLDSNDISHETMEEIYPDDTRTVAMV